MGLQSGPYPHGTRFAGPGAIGPVDAWPVSTSTRTPLAGSVVLPAMASKATVPAGRIRKGETGSHRAAPRGTRTPSVSARKWAIIMSVETLGQPAVAHHRPPRVTRRMLTAPRDRPRESSTGPHLEPCSIG